MKLSIMAMGFFALFLLSSVDLHASVLSDVGHIIERIASDPIGSSGAVAKIITWGVVAYQSAKLAGSAGSECYNEARKQGLSSTLDRWEKPFKKGLTCAALLLLSCECGEIVIRNIKSLK